MNVYGIKNCDKVKKQLKQLEADNIDFEFVDLKKFELTAKKIKDWKKSYGDWPVNKRGRTYKQIAEKFESASESEKCNLICENTSSLIRPIFEKGSKTYFDINDLI